MRKHIYLLFVIFICTNVAHADEGMWIPMYLNELNEPEMQAMGMHISAEDIYNENHASLKDAIVIFGGGCTGGVVSDEGLLLTNYHCGYSRIQAHSSLQNDYLTQGFWATDKSNELPNPGLTVTFLVRMEEVTDRVLEGVNKGASEKERDRIIAGNIDKIEAEAIGDSHYTAVVKPFYYGNRYFLFVNEIYKDVRLVGAPPSNIGKFGGDTDNWVWPRHTGDFSVFRIYADSNNLPAEYNEKNIPYHPKKHFNVSLKGVDEDDFTFVFGYPGSTEEYIPSYAVEMQVDVINPIRIGLRGKRIDIFNSFMNSDPEIRIQYANKQARIANGWKKWIGENRGIKRLNTIEEKQQFEKDFTDWVNQSELRTSKYSELLPEFEKVYNKLKKLYFHSTYLREAGLGVEAINFARRFEKLVEASKDKNTSQETIDDLVENLQNSAVNFYKNYRPEIDKQVFIATMSEYGTEIEKKDQPEVFINLLDNSKGNYEKLAEQLFEKSYFVSEAKMQAFLDDYKPGHYKKLEKDGIYQLADGFAHTYNSVYLPASKYYNSMADSLMRIYLAAQMEMQKNKLFYPDANFTLRVTYGNVKGYNPDDALHYRYYTTLEGIMEKENPEIYDYVVEDKLKELYQEQDFGRYGDEDGSMHVCFVATNHTSGGNSGSPVLDADGNLIGLNFDRCWEGTMSDIDYDITQCRNITLDIRYCLFIIDKFAGAGYLVDEMTVVE